MSETPKAPTVEPRKTPKGEGGAPKRGLKSAAVAIYLAIQLLIPIGPFLIHPAEGRADFSWDMFSYRRKCPSAVCPGFHAISENGRRTRIGWGRNFKSRIQIARIRYVDRLKVYGHHLCGELEQQLGGPVEIRGECECRYHRTGPLYPIIDPDRDYCEAP